MILLHLATHFKIASVVVSILVRHLGYKWAGHTQPNWSGDVGDSRQKVSRALDAGGGEIRGNKYVRWLRALGGAEPTRWSLISTSKGGYSRNLYRRVMRMERKGVEIKKGVKKL